MTLSDLSAIGSLVSGLAVLVSLIFLAAQKHQNTQAVRAVSSQAHAANMQDILSPIIIDGEVARIHRMGFDNLDALTDDERVRFFLIMSGIFRFYEAARLQWRRGQLDQEHWHQVEFQLRDIIRHSGVQTYWNLRRHWHSGDFGLWVDSLPKEKAERGLYDLLKIELSEPNSTSGEY